MVLLLLVGSDLSMMEALNGYDRPFHQRGREMVVGPLNPADIGQMLDLPPAATFDAALITGGLPLICAEWRPGADVWEFLRDSLDNPVSALLVSAERSLAAEFPPQAMSREVLRAIGSGERTFTHIARAAGGIAHTTLTRATDVLTAKRVVATELPLSLRPSKERRYRVADPYPRFWLTFLDPHMAEIERMRGDLTLTRIKGRWTNWRGRAIEPLVRESLDRLLPDGHLPAAPAIGGYRMRSNDVEIDLVGADRQPVAKELLFLGSVKWLDNAPFDDHGLAALQKHRAALTDRPLPLVAVSRNGISCAGLKAAYGPDELLGAWRRE
ncbi:protein of unknown function [Streptomyces sp. 1222.2]|nr:protein of unknown function [Streptomyces sp. 1222.2]